MKHAPQLFVLCALAGMVVPTSVALAQQDKIPGIGPAGEVVKVQGGFKFTEGPAWDGEGSLYFSDIPAKRIHKLDAAGQISIFLEPSDPTNGLMFSRGTLFGCSVAGKIIAIDVKTKQQTVLADQYEGKRFNACNDLVLDRAGGIYFTDPRFSAPTPWPQGKEAAYYRSARGEVTRLVDNLPAPNGILLSPDEKTLYIVPSMQKDMLAYPLNGPGQLGEGRVFCTLQQGPDSTGAGRGGDGLTVDTKGNLYITSELGVQVFTPQGELLGIIKIPEVPANVTFGGRGLKTLYVTARTSLYAVELEATGHMFPGAP